MTRVVPITVGTGSPEGANSAYFLPDEEVLIDPGPPGEESWTALTTGIEDAGFALADVSHVLVTHWHADHTGLAPRLATAADATIHMHAADAPFVATYEATREERLERDATTLRRWGVPDSLVRTVVDGDTPSPMPARTDVMAHEDGDTVAGGQLVHTPGHTKGHAAFVFGDHVFVGDALLPTYTPNVGGSDTRVRDPLSTYLRTLERLELFVPSHRFHPGHGTELALPARVEQIRTHHDERTRRVSEHLAARGRATPWDIAGDLFGSLSGIHVKFGAGEAAAHLVALCTRGGAANVGGPTDQYEHAQDSDDD